VSSDSSGTDGRAARKTTGLPFFARAVVAFVVLAACLYGIWASGRAGIARLLVAYGTGVKQYDVIDEAAGLSPSDPDVHYARALALANQGRFNEVVEEDERAVSLRPRDYVLWLELGIARDQAGDIEGAVAAFRQAVRFAPYYAEPHWQLGNVLLRSKRVDEAFTEMRQGARNRPALLLQEIDLAWVIYNGDVRQVEQAVRPEGAEARMMLARFAAKQGKGAEAVEIFRATGNVTEDDRLELLRALLASKKFAPAYEVWSGRVGVSSSINNPGFEEEVKFNEVGFGWHLPSASESVAAMIDQESPHGGARSLKLEWKGDAPAQTAVVSQLVPVEPNTSYRLSYAVRTDRLVTGGLPLVEVTDASSSDLHAIGQSKPFPQGTSPWSTDSLEFKTGSGTKAISLVFNDGVAAAAPALRSVMYGLTTFLCRSISVEVLRVCTISCAGSKLDGS
jgi:Flp pilus assembly protein TadD